MNFYSHIQENSSYSNYYTLQEYLDIEPNAENIYNFFLLNLNIRSFLANYVKFEAFLECLPSSPHLIVVTETWNGPHNVDLCNVDGFNCAHTYRKESRGGGVSIFVAHHYQLEQIESLYFPSCNFPPNSLPHW